MPRDLTTKLRCFSYRYDGNFESQQAHNPVHTSVQMYKAKKALEFSHLEVLQKLPRPVALARAAGHGHARVPPGRMRRELVERFGRARQQPHVAPRGGARART